MASAVACAKTRRGWWPLTPATFFAILAGCDSSGNSGDSRESDGPSPGTELHEAPRIHPDTARELVTVSRRTVVLDVEGWSRAVGVTVESDSGMTVSVVEGVEVLRPQAPLRIERWRADGNGRPLTLTISRCDSIRMTVTEEVRTAAGTWIRYSTELWQNRRLPDCCETESRRRRGGR